VCDRLSLPRGEMPKAERVVRLTGFLLHSIMQPKQFRRYLRKESTTAEKILWFNFRNRKFLNLKIRRQHPIENFTADFYCDELKLIIEVDGSIHENQGQANYDYFRDELLKSKGYRILRIDNVSAINYTEATLEWLQEKVKGLGKNKLISCKSSTLSAFGISPKGRERQPRQDKRLNLITHRHTHTDTHTQTHTHSLSRTYNALAFTTLYFGKHKNLCPL